MADDPTVQSRGIFGWANPGRNIALIVVIAAFGTMALWAWLSGAL